VISPAQFAQLNVSPVFGSTNPGCLPRPPCWPPACVQWVPGAIPPCRCSPPRGNGRGRMRASFLKRQNPTVVRSPAFELAPLVGRSGWDRGRPPTQNHEFSNHEYGARYGFVLERLPSSGRTRCGVFRPRRWPSAGLPALGTGRAKRCLKPRKTRVLSVGMRSVDDWPLAKILARFPGVSCGW